MTKSMHIVKLFDTLQLIADHLRRETPSVLNGISTGQVTWLWSCAVDDGLTMQFHCCSGFHLFLTHATKVHTHSHAYRYPETIKFTQNISLKNTSVHTSLTRTLTDPTIGLLFIEIVYQSTKTRKTQLKQRTSNTAILRAVTEK